MSINYDEDSRSIDEPDPKPSLWARLVAWFNYRFPTIRVRSGVVVLKPRYHRSVVVEGGELQAEAGASIGTLTILKGTARIGTRTSGCVTLTDVGRGTR